MFTGLIEEVGNVVTVRATDRGTQLQIAASRLAKKTRSGDSIAVNGCKRALWWTFHSRAHRLCLADHRLPEERRRFSIGNRVTRGVRPLCRVQGLHCGEWYQNYCRRNQPQKSSILYYHYNATTQIYTPSLHGATTRTPIAI